MSLATFLAPTTGRGAALALPSLSAVQTTSGASIDMQPVDVTRRGRGEELRR